MRVPGGKAGGKRGIKYTFLGLSKRGNKVPRTPTAWPKGHVPPRGASHPRARKLPYHSAEHEGELLTKELTVCGYDCLPDSQSVIIGLPIDAQKELASCANSDMMAVQVCRSVIV